MRSVGHAGLARRCPSGRRPAGCQFYPTGQRSANCDLCRPGRNGPDRHGHSATSHVFDFQSIHGPMVEWHQLSRRPSFTAGNLDGDKLGANCRYRAARPLLRPVLPTHGFGDGYIHQYRHDKHHRSGGLRSAGCRLFSLIQRTNRIQLVNHRRERHG